MRRFPALVAIVGTLAFAALSAAAPAAATTADTVSVAGAVAAPAAYSPAQLAALPQATYPTAGGRTVTGVSLAGLVARSAPVLPPGKNTALRVVLTVTGRDHRAVAFALGELDPAFGNHPAVLTVRGDDVTLVVPGDRTRRRAVADVTGVRVTVSAAGVTATPPGAVEVITGDRAVTLSAARLGRLPARTLTVTFLAGTARQTHTETGPTLGEVLRAAGVDQDPTTAVVAVGSDGYAAAVTPAEDRVGGRPLLLSTAEDGVALARPRLVTDGDVKGGRYVSDVVALDVTTGE